MNKIFLLTHLGNGDYVIMNGMIRVIASKVDTLLLAAKKQYAPAMFTMFGDLLNVDIVYVKDADEVSPAYNNGIVPSLLTKIIDDGYKVIPLGYHTGNQNWKGDEPDFAKAFHYQVGLDPEISWSKFQYLKNEEKQTTMYNTVVKKYGEKYVFLHDDPKRDIRIPIHSNIPVIHPDDPVLYSDNIFDYVKVIEKAQEIHFFDSCFGLLVDRLQSTYNIKKTCYTTGIRPVVDGFYKDKNITFV